MSSNRIESGITKADMNVVAVAVTGAWLLSTLFFFAQPFPAIAVDPAASLRSTVEYTGFWTALAAPFVAALLTAGLMSWRAGGRFRVPHFRPDEAIPGLWATVLITTVWVGVSLAIVSEPGAGLSVGLLWLMFTCSLGFGWLMCILREASLTRKQPGIRNAGRMLGYAIPLPVAAIFLYSAMASEAALELRFELSEDALTEYVAEFEKTGEESMSTVQVVGLYQVGPPDRRHGCIRVTTNSEMDYYTGFAYCPDGPEPTEANEDFDHFRGDWWRFEVNH